MLKLAVLKVLKAPSKERTSVSLHLGRTKRAGAGQGCCLPVTGRGMEALRALHPTSFFPVLFNLLFSLFLSSSVSECLHKQGQRKLFGSHRNRIKAHLIPESSMAAWGCVRSA